ncbi:MBL fold metallo-hydrolase [Pseudonocardia alaniniphila]|uniref:MBL fold metallo-hydrolase n=1 Tax=Pseudonocardia alaniniphila TaxID=75291 RepID=A0ABS9TEH3_9PSEU|nr:MBL fold metallo-hydrolase [Pseudonocardia alaniniphila]MCH6166935.1 MBL fold metallo-hydrolase [Pseudonocardia alaniniphila]
MSLTVDVVETSELGDRSYIAHDGQSAIVVDPQRDLDRVERVLADRGLKCEAVLETHIHNDYVTGGLELSRRTGARYVVAAADHVEFDRHPAHDGEEFQVGGMRIRVIATPGHTDTHLSYRVDDGTGPAALFTGGSLLYGSVGRTDLVDAARTEELTHAQYRSAHRLAELSADADAVYPTHGFGSFCSSGSATGGSGSTIGLERIRNDALTEDDEDRFVERLIAGLTAFPSYYAHMGARNRQGPGPADLSPVRPVDPAELRSRIEAGEWVVDLRRRTAYSAAHIAGSIGIELGQQFATYLGWLIPWGTPLTLVGESAEQITDAQRQLVRIGIDRPDGSAIGTPESLARPDQIRAYPRETFDQLDAVRNDTNVAVLDVRRDDERASGSIPGSTHIPMHSLLTRLDELPDGQLWVHCASGFRASIAASLLDRLGRDVVLVDDDYSHAVELGLTTATTHLPAGRPARAAS